MDIKGLLDVTCKTVANMIKGKTPEEIRKTFNIKNDFTPQEEEQVSCWTRAAGQADTAASRCARRTNGARRSDRACAAQRNKPTSPPPIECIE